MNLQERKRIIAQTIASSAFFLPELFTHYYSLDFIMDCPNAPFGMPAHFNTWQAERCFCWLNRTVRNWKVELKEFYATPNTDYYWAICHYDANVHWGDHDGRFVSDAYLKIAVNENEKVYYLSWRIDPMAMLTAAGKPLPDFDVEKALERFDKENFSFYHSPIKLNNDQYIPPTGDSKEEIAERVKIVLDQHFCGINRDSYRQIPETSDIQKEAIFLPIQQVEVSIRHQNEKVKGINPVFAWVKQSSPWMYRDPRNKIYCTDDPQVFFIEMNNHGPGCFENLAGKTGHYQNEYLVYLRVDEKGYLKQWNEILCAASVYCCANIDVISFPYYY